MRWPIYWIAFFATLLLFAACKIDTPTEYQVNTPDCPWPPPYVTDSIGDLPLGCPWRLPNGEIVPGWPNL